MPLFLKNQGRKYSQIFNSCYFKGSSSILQQKRIKMQSRGRQYPPLQIKLFQLRYNFLPMYKSRMRVRNQTQYSQYEYTNIMLEYNRNVEKFQKSAAVDQILKIVQFPYVAVLNNSRCTSLFVRLMNTIKKRPQLITRQKQQFIGFIKGLQEFGINNSPLKNQIRNFLTFMGEDANHQPQLVEVKSLPIMKSYTRTDKDQLVIERLENALEHQEVCFEHNEDLMNVTIQNQECLILKTTFLDNMTFQSQLKQRVTALLNSGGGYLSLNSTIEQSRLIKTTLQQKIYPKNFRFDIIHRKQKKQSGVSTMMRLEPSFQTVYFGMSTTLSQKIAPLKFTILNWGLRGKNQAILQCSYPEKAYEIIVQSCLLQRKAKKQLKKARISYLRPSDSCRCINTSQVRSLAQYIKFNRDHFAPQRAEPTNRLKFNYLLVFNNYDQLVINNIYAALDANNIMGYEFFQLEYDQCFRKIFYLGFNCPEQFMLALLRESAGVSFQVQNRVGYLKKCELEIVIQRTSDKKLSRYLGTFRQKYPNTVLNPVAMQVKAGNYKVAHQQFQHSIFSFVYLTNFYFKVDFLRNRLE